MTGISQYIEGDTVGEDVFLFVGLLVGEVDVGEAVMMFAVVDSVVVVVVDSVVVTSACCVGNGASIVSAS